MRYIIIAALLLSACSSTSETSPEDNCDAGTKDCPDGFTNACLPGSKIVGACCYEAPDGRRNPIGICE
jgi:hypothetical protein